MCSLSAFRMVPPLYITYHIIYATQVASSTVYNRNTPEHAVHHSLWFSSKKRSVCPNLLFMLKAQHIALVLIVLFLNSQAVKYKSINFVYVVFVLWEENTYIIGMGFSTLCRQSLTSTCRLKLPYCFFDRSAVS